MAGTLVETETGSLPIEDITAGMLVYAHDPETGETTLKPVVQTFVNEATELVHVTVESEEIVCTKEHPFYSPVKGWTAACDLRAGDILVTVNGEYVIVEQVQHELLEAPVTVYNFEVEGFHTYYVGNTSVLVHNLCENNYSGTKSPKKVQIYNGTYTQYDNKGNIYSYTEFNGGHQTLRIDIQGRPHNGWLPHIHVYSYNEDGYRIGEVIYNIFGKRIG